MVSRSSDTSSGEMKANFWWETASLIASQRRLTMLENPARIFEASAQDVAVDPGLVVEYPELVMVRVAVRPCDSWHSLARLSARS